jgi:oligopeptide transport system permease protein
MGNYYVRRTLSMFVTLFLIVTITFFLMRAIPGGPFTREKPLPAEIVERLEAKYNLDAPLMEQYFDYLKGLITFDLGPSYRILGMSVNEMIANGFPVSAKIGGIAAILIISVGIPIGIISALKANSMIDYSVMLLATLGVTLPSFVLATGFIYIFAIQLDWVDATGLTSLSSYIGPVIALSGYSISFVARLSRSSQLEVLQQDYIRTARANGISEFKVIMKHGFKNSLIPVVTYVGPMVASILVGSFVVETMFNLPGIGRYFVAAVQNRDYTVIIGMTVFYALFYVVSVFLVDIAYSFIDPRIKLGN